MHIHVYNKLYVKEIHVIGIILLENNTYCNFIC